MLDELSIKLRQMIVDTVEVSGQGHIGPAFSLIEILRVIYYDFLNIRPDTWSADRDVAILSKGHGCLALYAILADIGFLTLEELHAFCRLNSPLGGHPERARVPGVEASTGALGHGFSMGVGRALAAKINGWTSRTAVIVGDGELNEGSVWEAAIHAFKHELSTLTLFVDLNGAQCYGPTRVVADMSPLAEKWRAFGFGVREVDGHDMHALREAVSALPFLPARPSVLICHTIKGKGLGPVENSPDWHYRTALSAEDIAAMRAALGGITRQANP